MPRILLGCAISVVLTIAQAQISTVDSLKSLIPNARGEAKLFLLNKLTYELINNDSNAANQYSRQAIKYGLDVGNTKQTAIAYTYAGVNAYLSGHHQKGVKNLQKGLALSIKSADRENQGYALLQLGNCYLNSGILDSSKLYYEKALIILKDSTNPINLAKLYRNMSVLSQFSSNAVLEQKYIDKALAINRALRAPDRMIDVLILEVALLTRTANYDSANKVLIQAERLAATLPNKDRWMYDVNYNRALLLIPQSKYQEAFIYIDSARKYLAARNNPKTKTVFLKNIGRAFSVQGDYELALENLYEAQTIAERENYFTDLLEVQCELGWVTYHIGDLALSLSFAEKALANSAQNKQPIFMVQALNLKGLVLTQLNRLSEARLALQADIDTCARYHDYIGLVEGYINLGILENVAKHQSNAIAHLNAALSISKEKAYAHGELWATLTLSEVYLQNNEAPKALEILNSSDGLQKTLKEKEAMVKSFELKKGIYKNLGHYRESLFFAEKAETLKDSIRTAGVINRFANLQKLDEIKQRETNIQLLLQQKELNLAQIKLKDSQIKLQAILGVLGVLGIIALAYVAIRFRNYYKRIKALNYQNQEKNEEIQAQAEELMQSNRVIQELNLNLEQKVEEKTNDLKKTNEELVRSNNNLQQFSYVVSHNLRGPIARLLGLTDILKSVPPGEEQEKILELTYKSSRELDQIVTDLSKIINLRGGQNPLELIDLKAEFDMAMQQNAVPEDHRKFIESDFSHAPTIRSVKAFIQSIFYNLLNNAFKYRSPDRELKVSIQSHESRGSIVITISDNGLGIDLTRHGGSVFKLFKRFHLNADGRGLGLYLVKEQVEALGGSIEIQSHPDKGTTFIIHHPV